MGEVITFIFLLLIILALPIGLFRIKKHLQKKKFDLLSSKEKSIYLSQKEKDLRYLLSILIPLATYSALKSSNINFALPISLFLALAIAYLFNRKSKKK